MDIDEATQATEAYFEREEALTTALNETDLTPDLIDLLRDLTRQIQYVELRVRIQYHQDHREPSDPGDGSNDP